MKLTASQRGLWTNDLDTAIKNQVHHIFNCIKLDDGIPKTVKNRKGEVKQTRGTSKLESFHKFLNCIPNTFYGMARADALITMVALITMILYFGIFEPW